MHVSVQSSKPAEGVTDLEGFKASLRDLAPRPEFAAPLAALWWAAKGGWDEAHKIVQDEAGAEAAWVHAYLHRVEGDLGNAGYWYRQAGQPVAAGLLENEWQRIVAALLGSAAA